MKAPALIFTALLAALVVIESPRRRPPSITARPVVWPAQLNTTVH